MLCKSNKNVKCVHVSEHSFTNQKDETIPFYRCILIDENGQLFQLTCDKPSFDVLSPIVKSKGMADFSSDRFYFDIRLRNDSPKIKLIYKS